MKRAIFPLIVFFLIVAALVYRLSSCTANTDRTSAVDPSSAPSASAQASSSAAAAALSPKPSASPDINYSNDDIIKLYKKAGFEVKDIRDAGSATIVRYCNAGAAGGDDLSRFAWFDRTTGARNVVCDGMISDRYEITPDKSLTALTTGRDYYSGRQWFPEIIASVFSDAAESVPYKNAAYPYYMPLDRSFTVSDDRPESLKSITFDFDAVSVGFVPQPGHESDFEAAFRTIPKTNVVTSSGICYITFYNTTLTGGFKAPKAGAGDSLRSFAGITCDGTNTLLTLKLGDQADRYNVSMDYSPDDGMPYAVFRFRSTDDIYPPYPQGW